MSMFSKVSIMAPEMLTKVQGIFDDEGPIIVERAIDRSGGGREWKLFDDMEGFMAFLREGTKPGDFIAVWSADKVLTNATIRACGKCPNEKGEVLGGGAY